MHTTILQSALIALFLAAALLVLATWAKGFSRRSSSRRILAFNALGDGGHVGEVPLLLEAAVATRHLLVRKGTASNQVLLGTATDRPLGFAEDEGAIGDTIAIHPLGLGGRTVLGVASAAIAANALLSPAASGKLRTLPVAAGTYWVIGYAITAAGADGDQLELVSCVPYSVTVT
jgi:hypothetical protein